MRKLYLTTTYLASIGYNTGEQGSTMKTPTGRIVWGHPLKPRHATDNLNNKKYNEDGSPTMETSFGLAIPTAEFQASVWPMMLAESAKGYPNGVPGGFSWKMTQDHEIDKQGKPYSAREGYAGHVVLAISTNLEPPPAFKWSGTQWQQMQPDEIKCGDYVQVEINFKVNVPINRTHTPSIYVNPRQIAFVGYGTEIKTGFIADPNATFGAGPAALPPGASAVPVASGPDVGMPGGPGTMSPAAGQPGMGVPGNAAAMPGAPAMGAPPPAPPPAPLGPQRPTDPSHIYDNGNGTEQWVVNGAWDGVAHPIPAATLPPPATGFVDQAAGMPMTAAGTPAGMPGAGSMPGMPGAMPTR